VNLLRSFRTSEWRLHLLCFPFWSVNISKLNIEVYLRKKFFYLLTKIWNPVQHLREATYRLQAAIQTLFENSLTVFADAHCFAGLKNGDIRDTNITASSVWDNNHAGHRPGFARLDLRAEYTHSAGAWISGRRKLLTSEPTANQI